MPVPFMKAAEGQCRFPLWEHPAERKLYCGKPVKPGSSFCPACHNRVYIRVAMRPVATGDLSVRRERKRDDDPVELTEVFA